MIDPCSKSNKQLPEDFTPSPHSVIIGRAKECKQAVGNKRLRILCSSFLSKYSTAINRSVKSQVVSEIVSMVRDACPIGAFIKKVGQGDDCIWVEVNESTAREKVGYVFRDLLSDQYRSSSKSKAAKRQRDQELRNAAAAAVENKRHASLPSSGVVNSCAFDDCMRMARTVEREKFADLQKIPSSLFSMGDEITNTFINTFSGAPSNRARDMKHMPAPDKQTSAEPLPYTTAIRRQSDVAWLEMMQNNLFGEY